MHVPVLLQEVIDGLQLQAGTNCIDGTVGAGGHAEAILQLTGPDGKLIGFDRDAGALALAGERLAQFGERFIAVHDSYANLSEHAQELAQLGPVGAILVDLGLSSMQLDSQERGFAFRHPEAGLDMRFDQTRGETAAELLNTRTEEELAVLFREYGEVRRSQRLAEAIVEGRERQSYETVRDLLMVVERVLPRNPRGRTNPATTVFQALRIAVNTELAELKRFLPLAVERLVPGGRLAVISFHSLEDRMVKHFFREAAADCVCPVELPECRCDKQPSVKVLTRRPIIASEAELATNPRARSAKLRIVEKI